MLRTRARRSRAAPCPICGHPDALVRAEPHPYAFLQCVGCGAFRVDPMPEEAASSEAGEHYTGVYYDAERRPDEERWEAAAADAAARRMARIEAALGTTGRFLDVGAGTGFLVAAARDAGWDARGVEVSATAAGFARERLGVPITVGTVSDAGFPDASFDAVCLIHVFEHVPDPRGLLNELGRILVPGGVLNVAVPNARGLIYSAYNVVHRLRGRYERDRFACSLYPPDHLYAFDERSLGAALRAGGFEVRRMTITGKGDPDHYPVVTWRGSGRAALAEAAVHRAGRALGRGSIIDCIARPA